MTNSNVKDPIIYQTLEESNNSFLNSLSSNISDVYPDDKNILLSYPTVYIHDFKNINGKHNVYVGETNNIISRTKEHYNASKNDKAWQRCFETYDGNPSLYIIGHAHFNKSLTLDIENRILNYMYAMDTVNMAYNSRPNPQSNYYPDEELEPIFNKIWNKLRRLDKDLFLSQSRIKESAIYKASPLHKLTHDQEHAQEKIVSRVASAIKNNKTNQLVFVEGGAGTGKTVLTSSTFYELVQGLEDENAEPIKCCLLVNHDEQHDVYKEIVRKLNLFDGQLDDIVCKPTHFINKYSKDNMVDVAFVDEAHLLLTQGRMAYTGKNQLADIMERARVTVVMFDRFQVLASEEYWEPEILDRFISIAKKDNNYIELSKQLRVVADDNTIEWLDKFTKDLVIEDLLPDSKGYEVKTVDTPEDLYKLISNKANYKDSNLSRIVATYDWEYNIDNRPEKEKYWEVKIGDFHKPWNRELQKDMDRKQKNRIKNLAWAEQPQTIDEIGSTYTIQGFDLSYAGVILGPSIKFRNGKIEIDPDCSCSGKAKKNRTLSDGVTVMNYAKEFIQNELRILMTRGVYGLYIYACDDALREELNRRIK
ncbi:MAG: DUF2075 domain-containing protein [Firmicutes bacterium]|nr:DUF2075 domain-containing protein [Candidatus Colivicinus equi]